MIIYSDGQDVVVTDSSLQVKKKSFNLKAITNHYLRILPGGKAPGLLLIAVGFIVGLIGLLKFLPYETAGELPGSAVITSNTLALWIGGIFILVGAIIVTFVRERYAVHLKTTDGEKDAVISERKEYITQIDEAIHVALKRMRMHSGEQRLGQRI